MYLYCANNNTIYPSISAAADDLDIDRTSIHRYFRGERTTAAHYVFIKLDDISPDKVRSTRAWLLYSAFKIILDVTDEPIMYERGKKYDCKKERSALGSHSNAAGAAGKGEPGSRQHDRAVQGRNEPGSIS